jgi:hypothetical protein
MGYEAISAAKEGGGKICPDRFRWPGKKLSAP